jgi:hypothetical protein
MAHEVQLAVDVMLLQILILLCTLEASNSDIDQDIDCIVLISCSLCVNGRFSTNLPDSPFMICHLRFRISAVEAAVINPYSPFTFILIYTV